MSAYDRAIAAAYALNVPSQELGPLLKAIEDMRGATARTQVRIPTDTMEQEYQAHYRRGLEARNTTRSGDTSVDEGRAFAGRDGLRRDSGTPDAAKTR